VTEPRIYLDYNATAPLITEAREALIAALALPGNASSVHGEGRQARRIVEAARAKVAALVGAAAKSIIFTSGATEANVTALTPNYVIGGKSLAATHLIVSSVEHPSALKSTRFDPSVTRQIPVDANGVIDLAALAAMVADVASTGGVPLVALQLANNETGVIQPVPEAARIVHAAGGIIHCDAVQAAGRIPIDVRELGVDTMALSAHKIGGAQGVGALILAEGRAHPAPLITGGGQEGWRRAGTEPVAGIAAFGAAAEAALVGLEQAPELAARRDRLQAELVRVSNQALVFAGAVPRLPNTIALAVPGVAAETAVIAFDLAGVALSSGSACSSGKVSPSHVLKAMGVSSDLARGGLRLSIGMGTTDAELDRFIAIWGRVMGNLACARAS
jgi:cysteine desulfurase